MLPLPVAAKDVFIISVFGMFLAMKALKLVRIKPAIDVLDLWLIINLLYVRSAFIRHPVGSLAMGSDRVGGRPVFQHLLSPPWLTGSCHGPFARRTPRAGCRWE